MVEKTQAELERILQALQQTELVDDDKIFLTECVELAVWIPNMLQDKNIKLSRLRKLIFGKGSGKDNRDKKGDKTTESKPATTGDEANEPGENDLPKAANEPDKDTLTSVESTDNEKPKAKGHGRMPHTVYQNAEEIWIPIEGLAPGDNCPLEYCNGRLSLSRPGVIVRIKGQTMAAVKIYRQEKLRCNLCGYLICAVLNADVGDYKYDEATPFDEYTGFARVKKKKPTSKGVVMEIFLLAPDSTQYKLANSMNQLEFRITALDLSNKRINEQHNFR